MKQESAQKKVARTQGLQKPLRSLCRSPVGGDAHDKGYSGIISLTDHRPVQERMHCTKLCVFQEHLLRTESVIENMMLGQDSAMHSWMLIAWQIPSRNLARPITPKENRSLEYLVFRHNFRKFSLGSLNMTVLARSQNDIEMRSGHYSLCTPT